MIRRKLLAIYMYFIVIFLNIFKDMDSYKKKVRDDVFMWQSALKALTILDWLIIVVVHDDNKVKTKILRTSVYDKVKSEFGSRNSNR